MGLGVAVIVDGECGTPVVYVALWRPAEPASGHPSGTAPAGARLVALVDPTTLQLRSEIGVPFAPAALAAAEDGQRVLALHTSDAYSGQRRVSELDLPSGRINEVGALPKGAGLVIVVVAGDQLVADAAGNRTWRMDLRSGGPAIALRAGKGSLALAAAP